MSIRFRQFPQHEPGDRSDENGSRIRLTRRVLLLILAVVGVGLGVWVYTSGPSHAELIGEWQGQDSRGFSVHIAFYDKGNYRLMRMQNGSGRASNFYGRYDVHGNRLTLRTQFKDEVQEEYRIVSVTADTLELELQGSKGTVSCKLLHRPPRDAW